MKLKNNKDLKKTINDFIEKNKIVFKGTTVAIVVSGVVMGTVFLNNPKKTEINNPYSITQIINQDLEKERFNSYVNFVEEKTPKKTEVVEKKIDKKASNKTTKTVVKKTTTKKTTTTTAKKTTVKKTTTKEPVKNVKKTTDESNNSIMVKVYRSNGTILNIELEKYVIGVVAAEMPASFQSEALKAQAVLARTYAMKCINKNIKLTDNSSTQNYKSNEELKKVWGSSYNTYYSKIKKAVNATKGEYLTYKGEIIEVVYHSTSNGKTESSQYVWGNAFPYLISVESKYDTSNPSFKKDKFITYQDLSKIIGYSVTKNSKYEIIDYTTGNRVNHIKIDNHKYTGVEIRNLLGLRSADFSLNIQDNGITFTTKGYGHGVGMSQYGANGYAKNGMSYKYIINHYYKGVTLKK